MGTTPTVLVVVDDALLRKAITHFLRWEGYAIVAAENADAADEFLADHLPDLVICDMMLPGRSGFQVVRVVKERSDWQVPVVMLSGAARHAHRDYAYAVGADAVLTGPFAPAILARTARELCPSPKPTAPLAAAV